MTPYTRRCTLQEELHQNFMGWPRSTRDIPLRPIVSNRGTTSYEATKELARILRPLVGKTTYHIKNSKDFVNQIHGMQLQQGECISSYDVSALFTSVPTDPALNIIKSKHDQDQELHLRTSMTVEHIFSLLEFCCLKTTYFQFQGRFFEQLQGAAMGHSSAP